MRDTGIVRSLDEVGRIVLPKEIRRELKLTAAEKFQIFIDADNIVLKPQRTTCFICGEEEEELLAWVSGCVICEECARRALQTLDHIPLVSHEGA